MINTYVKWKLKISSYSKLIVSYPNIKLLIFIAIIDSLT